MVADRADHGLRASSARTRAVPGGRRPEQQPGDTTGAANPVQVRQRIGELLSVFPGTDFIAHFHDTRGNGIVNSVAALELGLRYVDTSLGAIGGQPATGANKYQ